MKVVYTEEALRDLGEALDFVAENYSSVYDTFQSRIGAVVDRIKEWPASAEEVEGRSGVFAVPLVRYPYKLFYQVRDDRVEILHISHTAQAGHHRG